VLALTLQLQPPPQHRPSGDLAGMHQSPRAAAGPGPARTHSSNHAGRLPGEVMAGLGSELAGHRLRQRPSQDREAGVQPNRKGPSCSATLR
jgi:hypothetical protein